jgi:hypothetical protein
MASWSVCQEAESTFGGPKSLEELFFLELRWRGTLKRVKFLSRINCDPQPLRISQPGMFITRRGRF